MAGSQHWEFLPHVSWSSLKYETFPQLSLFLAFETIHGKFSKCLVAVSFPDFGKPALHQPGKQRSYISSPELATSWKICCSEVVPKSSQMYPHKAQEETDFLSISVRTISILYNYLYSRNAVTMCLFCTEMEDESIHLCVLSKKKICFKSY